jgi:hypothetical protein
MIPLYLQQLLLVAAPIVLPGFFAFLVVLVKKSLEKLPSNARPIVASIASTAVANVEQIAGEMLNSPGKKQAAMEAASAELAHWGINVPSAVLSGLVEEAVAALPSNAVVVPSLPMTSKKG